MNLYIETPYGYIDPPVAFGATIIPRVGEWINCEMSTERMRKFPNKFKILDNTNMLIITKIEYDRLGHKNQVTITVEEKF